MIVVAQMIIEIILSALFGGLLSLFFRYPVLIMASVAVLIVTCVNGIVDGRSLWFAVLSIVLSVTALQAGYVGGAVIQSQHRAQADALEIEALAKRRLADEYDEAQERGEVVGAHDGAKKRVPDENAIATAADIGLTRKEIFEPRQSICRQRSQ